MHKTLNEVISLVQRVVDHGYGQYTVCEAMGAMRAHAKLMVFWDDLKDPLGQMRANGYKDYKLEEMLGLLRSWVDLGMGRSTFHTLL